MENQDCMAELTDSPDFCTYLFEYEFEGEKWGFDIKASSEEEAVRRVRALSSQALLLGERQFSIPAFPGFGLVLRAIVAIRNFFH